MDRLPFTVYDFFGYLASGFLVLCALVTGVAGPEVFDQAPSAPLTVLYIIIAYIVGHMVANVAGYLIERRLVRHGLGLPVEHLMGARADSGRFRLVPGYHAALPAGTRERVLARAGVAGVTTTDEALFFHAHAVMKSEPTVQARLNTFLNLYGFCRNMTVALLVSAGILIAAELTGDLDTGQDLAPGWWIGGAGLGAVGMLYRYLKFFRQYGVELLTSFAEKGG
jgi:hypothetical protein